MQNTRVRNLFSTMLGVGVVAGGMVLSSCEDEFTEQDAIKAQQESLAALKEQDAKIKMDAEAMADSLNRVGARIDYTVNVVAANKANTGNSSSSRTSGVAALDGVKVKVTQGGNSIEKSTEGGVAVFEGLKPGSVIVTIAANDMGYSSVTYNTLLGSDSEVEKETYNVGTLIPVFPVTKEAGATIVKGKAYAEFDATNDMAEKATGAMVQATISVNEALKPYSGFTDTYGEVTNATYEGFKQTATVDENGEYELIVPTGNGNSGNGIKADIEFLPFEKEQTYVKMNDDGTLSVEKKMVIFGDGGSSSHLETNFPSVYMEIGAPNAEPKDFAVEAKLKAQNFTPSFEDLSGGTGYEVDDLLEFPAGEDDQKASFKVASIGENGVIESIKDVVSANYKEKPGTLTGGSGSGAAANFEFTPNYTVEINNPGSGYWTKPTLKVATIVDGKRNVETPTFNLNGESIGEKGIVITTVESDEVPTFTIDNPVVEKAMINPRLIEVNEDGMIDEVVDEIKVFDGDDIELDGGAGYLTSPAVTFKDVNGEAVAGVEAIAEVNGGKITSIKIIKGGSGIRAAANDTVHEELDDMDFEKLAATEILKPGSTTNVVNHNYGGGAVK